MKHYFTILALTWGTIAFVLLLSWIMLLVGVNLGQFTVCIPVAIAFSALLLLSQLPWFDENVRGPLSRTLEAGDRIEVMIHLQLFTLICGVAGLGLGLMALTAIYPIGIRIMFESISAGQQEWYNFTHFAPLSAVSGLVLGVLIYAYLFADARKLSRVKYTVLFCGFFIFFVIGMYYGDDKFMLFTGS